MKSARRIVAAGRLAMQVAAACAVTMIAVTSVNATPLNVNDFGGVFGNVDGGPNLLLLDGLVTTDTSGQLTADIGTLIFDLTGWSGSGDPVGLSDIILIGTGSITGSATYKSLGASLTQVISPPAFPIGLGEIQAKVSRVSNTLMRGTEIVAMPATLVLGVTYNAVVVPSVGGNGLAAVERFASASISAVPVPEPSTFVLELLGAVGLVGYLRRRRESSPPNQT